MGGYNHKPWCTCGWCFKSSTTSCVPNKKVKPVTRVSKDLYKWDYSHIKKIETDKSFVNPNAKCPVCKVPVFFYQSPYGGKVFFDELGPPWTKHPCTNNYSDKKPLSIKSYNNKNNFSWISSGWKPHIIRKIERNNNKIFSFDTDKNSYISVSGIYSVKKGSILHIKKGKSVFYEASILNENNSIVKVVLLLKNELKNFSIQILTDIFFKAYREENKKLMQEIINYNLVKSNSLDKVFRFIYDNNINIFLVILRNISHYCPKNIIEVLISTSDKYVKAVSNDIFKY